MRHALSYSRLSPSLSLFFLRLHHNTALSETGEFSAALRGLVVQVWSEGVSTLHCPRAQLELTGVMRRTTHNTTRTLSQVDI